MAGIPASSAPPLVLRINLGGEGEVGDCINQQPTWADLGDLASRTGQPLRDMLQNGTPFLFCDNTQLPFPECSVDEVLTNGVPIDRLTWKGPGISSNEIKRVLKSGGIWWDNGVAVFTRP
jgi:hypothetical protein